MGKQRKFYNKSKSNIIEKEEELEVTEQKITPQKTPNNTKSILLSGTKYAYIIAAAALLSGVFTPLTLGVEFEDVVFGMLSIFLGLTGGIVIFLGIKNQKFTTIMVSSGLGMMIGSLILIYEMADRSLFV